jgi:hypothetical protein
MSDRLPGEPAGDLAAGDDVNATVGRLAPYPEALDCAHHRNQTGDGHWRAAGRRLEQLGRS